MFYFDAKRALKKIRKGKEKCKRCGMLVRKGSNYVGHTVGCDKNKSKEDDA